MVDETNKSYIINTALILPEDDGSGQPFSVEALKAELAESGWILHRQKAVQLDWEQLIMSI